MVGKANDHGSVGTVLLCIFACLLLFFSHTAASTLSELDGQADTILLPHPREVYYRLRSSSPPLFIVSSFVSSIFPSSSAPYMALSYARTVLTSVMASLFPSLGNLDIDLPSSLPQQHYQPTFILQFASNESATAPAVSVLTSVASSLLSSILPTWLQPEIGLRSLFPFLLVVGLVLYLHHDPSYPYMLHGTRPKLPLLPDLQVAPRLGHRVGSKRGRKLSAVLEEDCDSEEDMFEVEDEMESLGDGGGLVRERGLDMRLRQELSERQSLGRIAEESG